MSKKNKARRRPAAAQAGAGWPAPASQAAAPRARTPVTVAALRLLGATVPDELATAPVIGGSAEVGVIRAAAGLAQPPGFVGWAP